MAGQRHLSGPDGRTDRAGSEKHHKVRSDRLKSHEPRVKRQHIKRGEERISQEESKERSVTGTNIADSADGKATVV